jgi:hypothetical protein
MPYYLAYIHSLHWIQVQWSQWIYITGVKIRYIGPRSIFDRFFVEQVQVWARSKSECIKWIDWVRFSTHNFKYSSTIATSSKLRLLENRTLFHKWHGTTDGMPFDSRQHIWIISIVLDCGKLKGVRKRLALPCCCIFVSYAASILLRRMTEQSHPSFDRAGW